MFKIQGVNHVGLAPKDPEKARWFLCEILGMPDQGEDHVVPQKTKTAMFGSGENAVETRMEVLIPDGSDDAPIAKFLEKRGAGVHHVALTVDSIDAALEHLAKYEIEMIDKTPRAGAHNTRIAFVHPRATGGLLIELVEETA